MLNIIIIEDERPSRENLLQVLSRISVDVHVLAMPGSVKESIDYLSQPCHADIIFCDVQLPDGLSFEIFERCTVESPVIYVTAYDEFIMQAFEKNGIDYLLKPVSEKEMAKALQKYRMLQQHFLTGVYENGNNHLTNGHSKRSRVIVKKGIENIALLFDDVVLFYTEKRLVYVVDKSGKKYLVDKNLSDLETELDQNRFFRANRQYIVNIDYIKSFRTYEKVKLLVDLNIPVIDHTIIISQETAPVFRKWVYEL